VNSLWIGGVVLSLIISACEKRKGVLMPPRNEPSPTESSATTATNEAVTGKNEMRAKTLPDTMLESGEKEDNLVPLSDIETQDLQKVKQDALDRIKKDPADKLASGTATKGKAAALFQKGRQLMAQGNVNEAKEYYLVACQFGHVEGCHKFGWQEERLGNPSNARQFYKIACEGGLSKSCNNMGFQLEKQQQWDDALDFYARACLENHSVGCENMKRLREQVLEQR
jgi:hypothetical protein